MRRIFLAALLSVTSLIGTAGTAAANNDTVAGTRFDMIERSHSIEVKVDRGQATLVVTRTVENPGPKSDQAMFHLFLPKGAVATRLRTAGVMPSGETMWFEGELLEAEEAAKRYRELTGIGGYYPKDPALLSWREQGHLALQVFPVPAKSTKVVEYTLRMPLTYADGTYKLELPKLGTEAIPAKLHFSAANAGDRLTVNGVAPAREVLGSRELSIELTPESRPFAGPLEGSLASFGYAKDKNLVHAHLDVAKRLSTVPANASVVVLIDVSRSMEHFTASALTAARAYLASFPGANVEVMTFDRKVHSPFGGMLPVKEALSRLYGFAPTQGNGSHMDDALSAADAKLAAAPAGHARRLLVLTDMNMRTALTEERFAAKRMTSGAVVHLAEIHDGGAPELERDDDSNWAKLPRRTGGLFWRATSTDRADEASRVVFEEWVRPKRIEKVVVKGLPSDASFEPTMKEGQGFEFLGIAGKASPHVSLEGELWSTPIRWSTAASAEEGKRWAALAFGSDLIHQFDDKEMMTLAMHGRAVSPVTSYLAIEPGVRPSTEGLEWEGTGEGGGGRGEGIGLGSIGTIGYGAGGSSIDKNAFLNKALANALSTCQATGGASATVRIETTRIEIVDLRDVTLAPTRDAKIESCITENLWSVMLPSTFTDASREWNVSAKL